MKSMQLKAIFAIVILMGLTAACGQQEQGVGDTPDLTPPTLEPAPEKFPFEGIWFEQERSSMLVITAETVYLHEFESNREVYARIDEVDLETETITAFITGILIGGRSMGYDAPNILISYHVNGTVLEFMGQHLDFAPDEDGPVIYIMDEFLNPGK